MLPPGGRWPSARASQDGGSNPATPTNWPATVCVATNVGGATGSPILRRIVVAISGCRSRTMERQSAQLAQKTARLVRTAFRRPIPPRDRGIVAMSRTVGFVSRVTPKMFRMQLSIRMAFSECLDCLKPDHPQHVVRASTCTMQEEGTRRLHILNHGNASQQHVMFLQNFPQERLDPAFPRCGPIVLMLATWNPSTPWRLCLSTVRSAPVRAEFQLRSRLESCQCLWILECWCNSSCKML